MVSPAVRKAMQGNKSRNTTPELAVRRMLREAGCPGYRLHWKKAPGKPDIAFPGRRIAVFVNGCFWHRHKGCEIASMPKSNVEFWKAKFTRNVKRDKASLKALCNLGWTTVTIWECEIAKGMAKEKVAALADEMRARLRGKASAP
ncbi:MAG: very short patch repair endonuclease [Acidobacteriota bacterium]|jgi:DNA mismatch endonuclease (patch repair protein)|nr:very short patch repair endonuclease [Acidobacteriota bacterium]